MPTFQHKSRPGSYGSAANQKAADVFRQPPSCMEDKQSSDPFAVKTLSNREHTVCFTGHRIISRTDAALSQLSPLLELLYAQGYRDFLCGGAMGFDLLAAEHVIALRDKHPDVRLIFCLPCADQSSRWHSADCRHYEHLLYRGDEIRVLSPGYYDGCMQVRNAYMVDRSYLCVAYMAHLQGGTLSTVRYALSQDVPVVNIAIPSALEEYRQSL